MKVAAGNSLGSKKLRTSKSPKEEEYHLRLREREEG